MSASRRCFRAIGLVALVAGAAVARPATATVVAGSTDETLGPLISGTTSYVEGTFVWTDYAYDDRGRDTDGIPGGDAVYPAATDPFNAADLIQVHVTGAVEGGVRIGAIFETLVDPFLPVVSVGFDTDADPSTGAADLVGSDWSVQGALGLEQLVVVSGRGARLLTWTGSAWRHEHTYTTEIDQAANALRTTISALAPGRSTWRAVAAAGLDGSRQIFDLAFVRAEDPNVDAVYKVFDSANQILGQVTQGAGTSTEWQDKTQADVLTGEQGAERAVAVIDFAKVADGVTELATAPAPGWSTFLYYSPVNYGQGIQRTEDGVRFAGPYQPYGVRLPDAPRRPAPLVLFLHGANENHLQNFVAFESTFSGEIIQPGHFDPPAIVTFLLGRDPNWGTGAAEQDVLDVHADVSRRFAIDPERVVVTGISAGGAGTFRMASLRPDLFAGGFSLVGADPSDLLGNLTNVPMRMQNGLADPLVDPTSWLPTVFALEERGDVDFRAYANANRTHTHVPALGNCILRQFIEQGRVVDPARVQYTIDPGNEYDDPDSGLRIAHDGAYWVAGMVPRQRDARASVDVTSLGRADRARVAVPVQALHNNALAGEDYCGPNPAVRSADTWYERGVRLDAGAAQPVSNAMELTVRNLRAVTLDLARMALRSTEPLTITVAGDGPTALRLVGDWRGPVHVAIDGDPPELMPTDGGALTIFVGGGHSFVVTP